MSAVAGDSGKLRMPYAAHALGGASGWGPTGMWCGRHDARCRYLPCVALRCQFQPVINVYDDIFGRAGVCGPNPDLPPV